MSNNSQSDINKMEVIHEEIATITPSGKYFNNEKSTTRDKSPNANEPNRTTMQNSNLSRICPKIDSGMSRRNHTNLSSSRSEKQSTNKNRKLPFTQPRPFYHSKKPMARITERPGPRGGMPKITRSINKGISMPQTKVLKPLSAPNSHLVLPKTPISNRSVIKPATSSLSVRSSSTNFSNLPNNKTKNNTNSLSNMLNSRLTQMKNMQSKIDELKKAMVEMKNENRLLKRQNSRQEKALDRVIKNESRQSEIPSLAARHADEIRSLREQLRKSKEKYLAEMKKNKTLYSDNNKLKDRLTKLENLANQKKWKDQEIMRTKLLHLETVVAEKEVKIIELRKHIEHLQKNHWHEMSSQISKHKETQTKLQELFQRVKDLERALQDKDKSMGNKNIYRQKSLRNTASYSSKLSDDYSSDSCDEIISVHQRGDEADQHNDEANSKQPKSPAENRSASVESSSRSPLTATQPSHSETIEAPVKVPSSNFDQISQPPKRRVQSASRCSDPSRKIRQQRAQMLKQEKLKKETEKISFASGDSLEILVEENKSAESKQKCASNLDLYVTPCLKISSIDGHFSDLLQQENFECNDSRHVDFTAPTPDDLVMDLGKTLNEKGKIHSKSHSKAKDRELKSILKPVSKRPILKWDDRSKGERNSFESLATEILGVDVKKENELIQELFESNYTPSIHSISQLCDKNDKDFNELKSRYSKEIRRPHNPTTKVTFKSSVLPNITHKLNAENNDEEL